VIHVVEPAPPIYDMGEMPLNVPEINASIHADMERARANGSHDSTPDSNRREGCTTAGPPTY